MQIGRQHIQFIAGGHPAIAQLLFNRAASIAQGTFTDHHQRAFQAVHAVEQLGGIAGRAGLLDVGQVVAAAVHEHPLDA